MNVLARVICEGNEFGLQAHIVGKSGANCRVTYQSTSLLARSLTQ